MVTAAMVEKIINQQLITITGDELRYLLRIANQLESVRDNFSECFLSKKLKTDRMTHSTIRECCFNLTTILSRLSKNVKINQADTPILEALINQVTEEQ